MLTVGSVVGGYRIQRVLGSGGMGAVYLAADPTLPRRIALKVLSAELSRGPDFRARFVREADTAAALEHPHIVSVYNRGQTGDGQLWIAMQFVDGTDADAALRAGTMTPHRAVHVITEVAKALDFAHAHHVVHRDIKPANFLLSGPIGPEERVLLGDFGIARALDDAGLTATGSVLATVAYAAPEVLSNAPIDSRVDVYSLGCALYRLLTGQTPFPTANGAAGVMAAHLFSPPPRVTDTVPSLPAALDRVVAGAMAKDPAARFPSAGALAEAAATAPRDPARHVPLPPVPGGEVTSYPGSESAAPLVAARPPAHHGFMAGSGAAGAPPAPRHRDRRRPGHGAAGRHRRRHRGLVRRHDRRTRRPGHRTSTVARRGTALGAGATGHRHYRRPAAVHPADDRRDRRHLQRLGGPGNRRRRPVRRDRHRRQPAMPRRLGTRAADGLRPK